MQRICKDLFESNDYQEVTATEKKFGHKRTRKFVGEGFKLVTESYIKFLEEVVLPLGKSVADGRTYV